LDDNRRQQQMMAAEVDIKTAQIHEREQGVRELESQMYEGGVMVAAKPSLYLTSDDTV
jgi:hypothetical protein